MKNTVAVVVPLSARSTFTPDESITLSQLGHYLNEFDRYFVAPRSLKIEMPGFKVMRFDDRFFGSVLAHNKLMLSKQFYEAFSKYDYILQHHLDALVFSDRLLEWCQLGLDYIAAPWINCEDTTFVTVPRVGNGGLSLRKVESFLKVLSSTRYAMDPEEYWTMFCAKNPALMRWINFPRKYIKRLSRFNGVEWDIRKRYIEGRLNEDYFWSDDAKYYYPEFKVAPFEVGLRFAFEVAPRRCFEMNNHQLPFGCHAWPRYDRAFWEPYLLK